MCSNKVHDRDGSLAALEAVDSNNSNLLPCDVLFALLCALSVCFQDT